MSKDQKESLKKAISKYGFVQPIITNKDFLIADGQHRWEVAKELGFLEVPVVVLDIHEVDRRILRQVMNKLKGTHDSELDLVEFEFIFDNKAEKDLLDLLPLENDSLLADLLENGEKKDIVPTLPAEGEIETKQERTVECPKCGTLIPIKRKE